MARSFVGYETGMKYTALTKKAMDICYHAHEGHFDSAGTPYAFHPFHLSEQMETETEICVALLHDVVEDSDWTLEDLKREGFPEEILGPVALLTHDDGVPYMDYIRGIKNDPTARKVKLADLKHNMDLSRLNEITPADEKRNRKYKEAEAFLIGDLL